MIKVKVVPKGRPYMMIRKGIGLTYAEKNGRLVLKWEVTWKKINGIWINSNRGCYWISFRRHHL